MPVLRSGTPTVADGNPALAAQWDHAMNPEFPLGPAGVSVKSTQRAGWICPLGHRWDAAIRDRNRHGGCPICRGRRVRAGFNDLATTHPDVAADWDHAANGSLTPRCVSKGSTRVVAWRCSAHGHPWSSPVSQRSRGFGCPTCAGHIVAIGFNDLATTQPAVAATWDAEANSPLTPHDITSHTARVFAWICPNDDEHRWTARAADRSNGHGCPVCTGQISLEQLRAGEPYGGGKRRARAA